MDSVKFEICWNWIELVNLELMDLLGCYSFLGATRKVLLLENPNPPLNIRPNHVVQSYVLNALVPAAGCLDLYWPYFFSLGLVAQNSECL